MTNPIIPEAEVNAVKKVIEALEELKKLLSESREDEVDESVTEDEVKYNETSEEDYSELERSKSSINEPTRFIPIERVREGWDL